MNVKRKEELMRIFNERAALAKTFGMSLSFNDDGSAIIELPYNPKLNHAMGGIHGGVYATMADNAGWFAAAIMHKEGSWLATSELTIHYLKPSKEVTLRAVGKLIKHGKRQDIAEAKIYDENNNLVGHGIGTFMVVEKPEN